VTADQVRVSASTSRRSSGAVAGGAATRAVQAKRRKEMAGPATLMIDPPDSRGIYVESGTFDTA
jgi:hypothetical protein